MKQFATVMNVRTVHGTGYRKPYDTVTVSYTKNDRSYTYVLESEVGSYREDEVIRVTPWHGFAADGVPNSLKAAGRKTILDDLQLLATILSRKAKQLIN